MTPIRFELMTYGLGNRCSIQLSHGAVKQLLRKIVAVVFHLEIIPQHRLVVVI